MENPIKVDDLGVPLFSETSIWCLGNYLSPFLFVKKAYVFGGGARCECLGRVLFSNGSILDRLGPSSDRKI